MVRPAACISSRLPAGSLPTRPTDPAPGALPQLLKLELLPLVPLLQGAPLVPHEVEAHQRFTQDADWQVSFAAVPPATPALA